MKNFLLALMVVLTTCTLAVAQTTVVRDSIGKVKVTVTKDNKANTNNTAVTVIGVDTADADSADVNANSSNVSTTHGKASFTFDSDDSDFPFHNVSAGGGILVAIIAIIAYFISNLTIIPGSNPTNYYLNPNVAYLLFGIVFGEVGFLVKNGLQKAGLYGFTMLCLYSLTPNSFTSVTPESLLDMVIPLVGTLVFGAIGIAVFSVIAGKFLGYSVYMSIAIGMCALMGYPGTQIVTDDVVNALSASSEEKAAVSNVLLPRMLVGGFTTVSIASVVFAGIITPLIF